MSGTAKEKNRIAQRAYRERQKVWFLSRGMCLFSCIGLALDRGGVLVEPKRACLAGIMNVPLDLCFMTYTSPCSDIAFS